jgi:biopolymer transport protein ExbD
MKLKRKNIRAARIEMMPIIDIVFLLLVFFIYAMLSMAVHRGLTLNLPESSTATQSNEKDTLSISVRIVDGEMEITIDKVLTSLDELRRMLHAKSQNKEQKPSILLFAEENVSYQQLYQVLDTLKRSDFTNISLQASTE